MRLIHLVIGVCGRPHKAHHWVINELAAAGKGVIVISSEMPELLGICDRLYVMNEGRFVDEMPASEASQERIMASIMKQYGTAA